MKKLDTKEFAFKTIPEQQGLMKVIEDNARILAIHKMKITDIVLKISKDMHVSKNLVMQYTDSKKFREIHDRYYKKMQ